MLLKITTVFSLSIESIEIQILILIWFEIMKLNRNWNRIIYQHCNPLKGKISNAEREWRISVRSLIPQSLATGILIIRLKLDTPRMNIRWSSYYIFFPVRSFLPLFLKIPCDPLYDIIQRIQNREFRRVRKLLGLFSSLNDIMPVVYDGTNNIPWIWSVPKFTCFVYPRKSISSAILYIHYTCKCASFKYLWGREILEN